MTPAALKTYIYLRSRNLSQPVPVAVSTIAVGTGLGERSVMYALKLLRDHGLIVRHQGRGAHCNSYCIPDVPPRPKSALPISEPVFTAAEKQYTLRELVRLAYRTVTDEEFAELKETEPDQAGLYKKLTALHHNRSIPRSFTFDRFAAVVRDLVY